MKIAHICIGSFFNDGYSYQENLLAKYHKKLGLEVYVIAGLDVFDKNGKITYLKSGREYIGDYGIPVTRLNFKNQSRLSKRLRNYSGLESSLEKIKPDIIFLHNCQFISIIDLIKYLKSIRTHGYTPTITPIFQTVPRIGFQKISCIKLSGGITRKK